MKQLSSQKCFNGWQNVYRHASTACACDMTFAVYVPPQAAEAPVPVLWYLSGLTCTHENAMTKAHFQKGASELGLALIFPDTSPRGDQVPDDEAYDLGQGAGFYLNATKSPWSKHFRMEEYLLHELPGLLAQEFSFLDFIRQGVFGHSMGGHGALTLAMRNPDVFRSLSAFAPICHPTRSEWGRKQFAAYLGEDEAQWEAYDAALLMKGRGWKSDLLIDQGGADQFSDLLGTEAMKGAMEERGQAGQLRVQGGYDHSYFFITTFAKEHLEWHHNRLV